MQHEIARLAIRLVLNRISAMERLILSYPIYLDIIKIIKNTIPIAKAMLAIRSSL